MMWLTCLFVIFTMASSTISDEGGTLNYIAASVGELVELRCFQPLPLGTIVTEIEWEYMYQDICSKTLKPVTVAKCGRRWEYLSYSHHLIVNDSCAEGKAYMRSTEPGNFTYKCSYPGSSETGVDLKGREEFPISVHASEHSSIPTSCTCIAKHIPSSQNEIFDFICISYTQPTCINEEANAYGLIVQNDNGIRISPNITLTNKIVTRIEISEDDSVSEYRCISYNYSSPCVLDNVALSNSISVTPIVNQVRLGSNASFNCSFMKGHDRQLEYDWRISHHIELSRIIGTTSSTFKISNVRPEDDGVVVTCAILVNGTSFYSEALLKILSGTIAPPVSFKLTSATNGDLLNTVPLRHLTPTPSLNSSKLIITIMFVILFICALCVVVIAQARSKIPCRIRRPISRNPHVGGEKGSTPDESNTMPSASVVQTHRKPSVTSQSLPLIPSPDKTTFLTQIKNQVEIHEIKAMSSSSHRPTDQSPPMTPLLTSSPIPSHTYNVQEEQMSLLSISSSATIPKPTHLNPSRLTSTGGQKAETISESEPMTTDDTQYPIPLLAKTPCQHSCNGSPLISRMRKASATDYPLSPIPRSPGQCDDPQLWHETDFKLPLSTDLAAAVVTPVRHEYSDIQDSRERRTGNGPGILPKHEASAPSSPSAIITNDGRTEYSCGPVQKHLKDLKAGRPREPVTHDSNIYTVQDENTDDDIPSSHSVYHKIEEQAFDVQSCADARHSICHTDNASSAFSDTACPSHIYEMPVDDIPAKGSTKEQSESAEMPFYFTLVLEADETMEFKKVAKCQSSTKDQATKPIQHQLQTTVRESDLYAVITKKSEREKNKNV